MKAGWIMKFPPAFSVLVALLLGTGAVHGGDSAEDWHKLKGDWQAVEILTLDGRSLAANEVKAVKVTFAGADRMIFIAGKHEYSVKLDASKKPKAIDLKALDGESKGGVLLGIYQLDGDTLKLCVTSDPKIYDRPSRFTSEVGSKNFLYTFKRAKP
jgi:uncharacterized protein (TIGR03067 family)